MRFNRFERTQLFAVALFSLICLPAWSQSVSFQAPASTIHFTKASNPTTGSFPQSVAIGDFNGDGKQDIAVPVTSPLSDLTILLGNGNGTFTEGPILSGVTENVNNAVTGDFNGDGKLDMAISLANFNQVQILLGNGDGSFTPLPPISFGAVTYVATGDFNLDGKPATSPS